MSADKSKYLLKKKYMIVPRSEYVVNVEQTRGSKSAREKKRAVRLRNSKSTVRGVLNPSGLRIYPLNLEPDHTGRKKIVDFDPIKRESSPVILNLITGLFLFSKFEFMPGRARQRHNPDLF